ncbi:TY-Chap2 family putative peptide chaperone [Kocuria arenosa]|uniref:TY-Chap2 family putative peptide chaperone n=1 Tax=Kocuria arenosa TaxID=3071446 RepID=UPI0034D5D81D
MNSPHPLAPPTATVVEAASWTLAAEMTRRHPELTITRHHPGGGQYDCLAIRAERGVDIDLNRVGRIHVHSVQGGGTLEWEPVKWSTFLAWDPREFIALLEKHVRLPHVDDLPPTTPRVLSYRVLAAFARLHALGVPVEISMSTSDTSGMGGGRASWLADYPTVERQTPDQPFGFWHAKSQDTEFIIQTEPAILHRRNGSTVVLPDRYNKVGRNFGRLMGFVLASS